MTDDRSAGDFKYPRDLVAQLRAEWRAGAWRDLDLDELPGDDVLLPLIETSFYASLTSEEDRPTVFRLFLGEPTKVADVILFERPIPVSVQEIRRLVPAVSGMLGVRVGRQFRDCVVWGMVPGQKTRGLLVEVSGPGKMRVGNPLGPWVYLEGGHLREESLGEVGYRMISEIFSSAFADYAHSLDEPLDTTRHYEQFASWITTLLRAVSDLDHGGAIFLLPETETAGAWQEVVRVKYPCNHGAIWDQILATTRRPGDQDRVDALLASTRLHQRLDDAIATIAMLTQVDGAVVMTDYFRVLGFGVEVTAPTSIETIDDRGATFSVEDYGTRHRSAFRFVAACPYVTAFVFSQDGGLRCIRSIDGVVSIYR